METLTNNIKPSSIKDIDHQIKKYVQRDMLYPGRIHGVGIILDEHYSGLLQYCECVKSPLRSPRSVLPLLGFSPGIRRVSLKDAIH